MKAWPLVPAPPLHSTPDTTTTLNRRRSCQKRLAHNCTSVPRPPKPLPSPLTQHGLVRRLQRNSKSAKGQKREVLRHSVHQPVEESHESLLAPFVLDAALPSVVATPATQRKNEHEAEADGGEGQAPLWMRAVALLSMGQRRAVGPLIKLSFLMSASIAF